MRNYRDQGTGIRDQVRALEMTVVRAVMIGVAVCAIAFLRN